MVLCKAFHHSWAAICGPQPQAKALREIDDWAREGLDCGQKRRSKSRLPRSTNARYLFPPIDFMSAMCSVVSCFDPKTEAQGSDLLSAKVMDAARIKNHTWEQMLSVPPPHPAAGSEPWAGEFAKERALPISFLCLLWASVVEFETAHREIKYHHLQQIWHVGSIHDGYQSQFFWPNGLLQNQNAREREQKAARDSPKGCCLQRKCNHVRLFRGSCELAHGAPHAVLAWGSCLRS